MNKYFDIKDTVFNITEQYPELISFLVRKGFTPLGNPVMRKTMGRKISLETALSSKNLNIEECEKELFEIIERNKAEDFGKIDLSLHKEPEKVEEEDDGKKRVRIEGVLPCPIRIPLLESFEEFYSSYITNNACKLNENNYKISYDLRSANLGIDWIVEQVKTGKKENLPDILLSAGFELFFDKELMGSFIANKDFYCSIDKMNKDFCNDYIDLRDDKKNYAIIGVVPAIMVVNKAVLNGRKMPETWEDLLSLEFEASVSLPFRDLDLFNSVILNIYSRFGDRGVEKLAKACSRFLHPAQMVKGNQKESLPAVNISPYFFSKMIRDNSQLEAVWPKDGAIVAPIFMLVKKDTENLTKPFAEYFLSKKTGSVFAQSGFFPSTNPEVNNNLQGEKKFSWVGWDFIYQNDIGSLLKKLTADFEKAAQVQ